MKTIAFAKDPDGYWIELCSRGPHAPIHEKFNLSQTMLRVKDPQKSVTFYRDILGMRLIAKSIKSDFTLYFLAHLEPGTSAPENPEVGLVICFSCCRATWLSGLQGWVAGHR